MLEVSMQEMRKAALKNAKAAAALQGAHNSCKGILSFYSVESGLKALIMMARSDKTSSFVADKFGHNIQAMIIEAQISPSELGIVGSGTPQLPNINRANGGGQISFRDLHTAWRYGANLDGASDTAAQDMLERLMSAIRKRLFK